MVISACRGAGIGLKCDIIGHRVLKAVVSHQEVMSEESNSEQRGQRGQKCLFMEQRDS